MSEEGQLGPSRDGTVMLDIGGDIGALIILTSPELHLAEIEVSPVGDETIADPTAADTHSHTHLDGQAHTHPPSGSTPHRTHVAVRERQGPSGVRYAAIYPGLQAGNYTVWDLQGQPAETVHIVGGEVTQIDWR